MLKQNLHFLFDCILSTGANFCNGCLKTWFYWNKRAHVTKVFLCFISQGDHFPTDCHCHTYLFLLFFALTVFSETGFWVEICMFYLFYSALQYACKCFESLMKSSFLSAFFLNIYLIFISHKLQHFYSNAQLTIVINSDTSKCLSTLELQWMK